MQPGPRKEPLHMSKVDPADKAAECLRALELSSDPHRRALLISLRDGWIELARSSHLFSSGTDLAELLETIGKFHNALLSLPNVH
jgi:hypothetical protein